MKVIPVIKAMTINGGEADKRGLFDLAYPSPVRLPDMATLIVSGGDERITLDANGRNRYGHGPRPAPQDMAFGSSTASTISTHGWNSARETYDRISLALDRFSPRDIYDVEIDALRQRLRDIFGWTLADGPDLIVARSGTDAHACAATMCAWFHRRPTMILTVENSETGSGVAAAVTTSPLPGEYLTYHQPVSGRADDGSLRSIDEIENELRLHLHCAAEAGHAALLVVADVTKTGLISPPLDLAFGLRSSAKGPFDILIDACQLRLSRTSLRAYAARDCLIALTGSKFMTGPAFSGLLLSPQRFRETPQEFMRALSHRSYRGDWPPVFLGRDILPSEANFGLVLRWSAALSELEYFYSFNDDTIFASVSQLAISIEHLFDDMPRIARLATREPDRAALGRDEFWDQWPTIFSFVLKGRDNEPLDVAATRLVYSSLMAMTSPAAIRLGQPVKCGYHGGQPVEALRLCLSARHVTQIAAGETTVAEIVAEARLALDEAVRLAEFLSV